MKILFPALLLMSFGLAHVPPVLADEIDDAINDALLFSQDQAERLTEILGNDPERFVDYTNRSGKWALKNENVWTSGFVPGLFWRLYDVTGDKKWETHARHWTMGLNSRTTAADNDIGFQVFDSLGLAYLYTGIEGYKTLTLKGARYMVETRFNDNARMFRSWPAETIDPYATNREFEVNIDQMMNLELPLWAGLNGGEPEWAEMAVRHADASWAHLHREDASTYHVVILNPTTGEVEGKRTHQGWQRDSTWTRGQAWAVYGNVMVYRYTGEDRFLERSIASYDYFLSALQETSDDWVPPSDFDAPPSADNPKDSSASAIVASALVELYAVTGDERYINDARSFLYDLSTTYLADGNPAFESILLEGSEKWGTAGKVGTMFGDYFFVEAIARYKRLFPNGFDHDPDAWRDDGKYADFDLLEGDYADTGDWLGMLYVGLHPWVYCYKVDRWTYLPEDNIDLNGAWVFWSR